MNLPVLGGASAVIVVFWLAVAVLNNFAPQCPQDVLAVRLMPPFERHEGAAYSKPAPALTSAADSNERPAQSGYLVCENGVPLGPAHSVHAEIAGKGKGRFSHWATSGFIFSASDNSDPNGNGRAYIATRSCDHPELGGLCGTWHGDVAQQNPPASYPVAMQLYGLGGNTTYPAAGCGGRLEFLRSDGAAYQYREHVTYGGDKCSDGGIIEMRHDPSGNPNAWSWTWTGASTPVTGVLREAGVRGRQ
ncbi:MAG: hypothetical protein QOJ84_1449 [Bradyrhizobium sp.]|jgi:hypothetical protein|nr:hypothetical protein [Bradyrhizobium sp.]